eukprot:TRINITY_DN12242_c0_g1_i2.p1 TRINITY_DN12242_c0_g1~~TRINITY_DN12242_c0_g1_i2.p1  ORF type:complete len:126 (-),score=22.55 TRINITY_DN12242_c0_g1_i2:782-1159(-)
MKVDSASLAFSSRAIEKQTRKRYHLKAFKNPPEMVVSFSKVARKKTRFSILKLIVLSVMSGIYVGLGMTMGLLAAAGSKSAINVTVLERTENTTATSSVFMLIPSVYLLLLAFFSPVDHCGLAIL